ncbi:MAG TPA: hypothetical protein VE967_13845 [Gemmatimonadaceae bacterium]|nr:hypothetical protein [Gemmatimonadaceae bacterium]
MDSKQRRYSTNGRRRQKPASSAVAFPGAASRSVRDIIFSDLDGTFLDDRLRPAMDRAAFAAVTREYRVIWVSSRTAEDISDLQRELASSDDAIGESGAVVLTGSRELAESLGFAEPLGDRWVARVGEARATVVQSIADAFRMHLAPLHAIAHPPAGVIAAPGSYVAHDHRRASVLLAASDDHDSAVSHAFDSLRATGFSVAAGGRWVTVVRGTDKGRAVRAWLRATFGDGPRPRVIGIGNAASDAQLLEAADLRFVIRHESGHDAALARLPRVTLLERMETDGWREMLDLLGTRSEPAP